MRPYTEEQLLNLVLNIKALGEDQLVDMVEKHGVDFKINETFTKKLRRAGAGDAFVKAVTKVSDDRMRALRAIPVLGSSAAAAAEASRNAEKEIVLPPPLDVKGQRSLIAEAREKALNYTRDLPSFICLQVTKRYADFNGRGEVYLDTINARLSYDDKQHESYQVISVGERLADNKSMDALGGAISMGEFGSMLHGIFEPQTKTSFEWLRQGALRGRATEVYEYAVEQESSQWRITYDKTLTYFPAYKGRLWVDRETSQVLRMTMSAMEIPKDFPVRIADTMPDYDWADISGKKFLLPSRSDMKMSDGRVVTRNEIQFRIYRKFSAESVITFDTEDPKEEPPKPPKKP